MPKRKYLLVISGVTVDMIDKMEGRGVVKKNLYLNNRGETQNHLTFFCIIYIVVFSMLTRPW